MKIYKSTIKKLIREVLNEGGKGATHKQDTEGWWWRYIVSKTIKNLEKEGKKVSMGQIAQRIRIDYPEYKRFSIGELNNDIEKVLDHMIAGFKRA
jgi:hypothetical protein